MADVSKINVNGTGYNVKDATARTAASNAQTTANSKLSDAPSDGKQYARQDGAWAEVSSGGGSSETQPWPITSLDDDTIQKWATIPNGTYWYNNNGYFNSPEELGHGFLEHKVDADSFNVTQTFYGQSDQPTYRRSGNILGDFSYWFRFDCTELNKWYLPKGINESYVIAAYQFVNRTNETEALLNINNGTSYPLTKGNSVSWSSNSGFSIPTTGRLVALTNTNLLGIESSWYTFGFGYNLSNTGSNIAYGGIRSSNKAVYARLANGTSGIQTSAGVYAVSSPIQQSAVIMAEISNANKIFINGVEQSIGSGNTSGKSVPSSIIGTWNDSNGTFNVTALAIYNITLTASQHLQLANSIRALGGI